MISPNDTQPARPHQDHSLGPTCYELMALAKHLSRKIGSLVDAVESVRGPLVDRARDARRVEQEARRKVACGAPTRDGPPCRGRVVHGQQRCHRHAK